MKAVNFILLILPVTVYGQQDTLDNNLYFPPLSYMHATYDSTIAYSKLDGSYYEIFQGEVINRLSWDLKHPLKYGKWVTFDKDNYIKTVGYWYKENKVGKWLYYNSDHKLYKIETYKCGRIEKVENVLNDTSKSYEIKPPKSKEGWLPEDCHVPAHIFNPVIYKGCKE